MTFCLPVVLNQWKYLRLNNDAIDLIKKFNESNKIIAAICSGTMMLYFSEISKGKK